MAGCTTKLLLTWLHCSEMKLKQQIAAISMLIFNAMASLPYLKNLPSPMVNSATP
jgi:hypothetical protein